MCTGSSSSFSTMRLWDTMSDLNLSQRIVSLVLIESAHHTLIGHVKKHLAHDYLTLCISLYVYSRSQDLCVVGGDVWLEFYWFLHPNAVIYAATSERISVMFQHDWKSSTYNMYIYIYRLIIYKFHTQGTYIICIYTIRCTQAWCLISGVNQ